MLIMQHYILRLSLRLVENPSPTVMMDYFLCDA